MYEVIEMYGDNEPWWFFDNWEEDIEITKEFSTLKEATAYFGKRAHQLLEKYPQYKMQTTYLVAFWQKGDLRWCEECDDDLQQYKGLLLLKDKKNIDILSPEVVKGQHQTRKMCPYSQHKS